MSRASGIPPFRGMGGSPMSSFSSDMSQMDAVMLRDWRGGPVALASTIFSRLLSGMPKRYLLPLLLMLAISSFARADDWPQWLGPRRDGVWRESGLVTEFPKEGPKVLWRVPVGGGYAGPAVAEGKVFVTDRQPGAGTKRPGNPFAHVTIPGTERVVCFDEKSGKQLWVHEYDCPYSLSYSAGPRTTPAVDGDRVYTLGAEGDLFCLDTTTGKPVWSKHLAGDKSPTPTWGFAAHPLVDGEKLIVLTCGNDPAGASGLVTAFDKKTGKVLWTALGASPAGYCPPTIVQAGGTRQLIIWCPDSVNSLDPETGKPYWRQPHGPIKNGVSITTPRFYHDATLGDLLLISSANEGCLVLKLDAEKPAATVLWKRGGKSEKRTEALHCLMAPPTVREGNIYGICIQGELRCLDLKNGDRVWETLAPTAGDAGPTNWSTAFLIPLGDAGTRYLLANEHGDLVLADLDSKGYREVSRAQLIEPTNTDAGRPVLWCHPALADRCVFWRNDREMVCASLAADATK
ncbi:MAG: outer rane biosis protein BamB [Phycisphaerales bacterium]|jgi:outer membrane protein assembly factor BamB|nr:outer rane biosis protein BamB [Phycisphaerales bacterium]